MSFYGGRAKPNEEVKLESADPTTTPSRTDTGPPALETNTIGEMLEAPWTFTFKSVTEDADFKTLETFVLGKLPTGHKAAAEALISELKKQSGGGRRRMRGGANSSFYIKCMFLALLEVIIDGFSVAPKLVFEGGAAVAVILAVIASNATAVGAATAGATLMWKALSLYRTLTTPGPLTDEPEALAEENAAKVAEDQAGPGSTAESFLALLPREPPLGTTTQAMTFVTDPAAMKAAYDEEGEEPAAAAEAQKPIREWMKDILDKPEISKAMLGKAKAGIAADEAGSETAAIFTTVSRTFLFVFAVFYLRKLIHVIDREWLHNAQVEAAQAAQVPQQAQALANVPAPQAPAQAAPADLPAPAVAVAAVAAAIVQPPVPRPRRRSVVRVVAEAVVDAGGYEAGGESPPRRGGRRTRRRRRHRLSGPTRKGRRTSYGGRKRYTRQRRG